MPAYEDIDPLLWNVYPVGKNLVVEALDRAISETVDIEFARLTENMAEEQREALLREARGEILLLGELQMPNYNDEMVAVVYAVAYHLQHTNLAYSVIGDMLNRRSHGEPILARAGKLHVVDFGCGTLAMQFGLTLAVADALERGEEIKSVHIDSMDTNKPMFTLGDKLWEKFTRIVNYDYKLRLNWVRDACNLVTHSLHHRIDTINPIEGAESWLSVIHAAYDENKSVIQRDLAEIYGSIQPAVGMVTCYGRHDQLQSIQDSFAARSDYPFDESIYALWQQTGKELPQRLHCPQGYEKLRLTEQNRKLQLIGNSNVSRRTANAVLNWTWDIWNFIYTLDSWQPVAAVVEGTDNSQSEVVKPPFRIGDGVSSRTHGNGIVREIDPIDDGWKAGVDFGEGKLRYFSGDLRALTPRPKESR